MSRRVWSVKNNLSIEFQTPMRKVWESLLGYSIQKWISYKQCKQLTKQALYANCSKNEYKLLPYTPFGPNYKVFSRRPFKFISCCVILPPFLNISQPYTFIPTLLLLLVIIDKHCRVNLVKSWEKLESGLIIRNKLNFKSDLIFRNGGSIT